MPDWLPEIRKRLAGAGLDPAREAEIAQELAQHLDDRYAEMRALGADEDAARSGALAELNEDARMRRELLRIERRETTLPPAGDPGRGAFLSGLSQDIRYTLRTLHRDPMFTAVVVLMLTLGIGANTIMFGMVDQMLLRAPAQVGHADTVRRVYFGTDAPWPPGSSARGRVAAEAHSYPVVAAIRDNVGAFAAAAATYRTEVTLGAGVDARSAAIELVSADYFPLLELQPAAGRFFTPAEDGVPDAEPVVVLSHRFWSREFGAEPTAIGQPLRVQGMLLTIIGVAPSGFTGTDRRPVDFWAPMGALGRGLLGTRWESNHGRYGFGLIARLSPEGSTELANAQATDTYRRTLATADLPPMMQNPHATAFATPLNGLRAPNGLTDEARVSVWLLGVSALVLLIAGANVAQLLVTRTLARQRELALRLALGASRGRVLRQLLTESALLASLAAVAALGVAYFGSRLLQQLLLPGFAWDDRAVDPRVVVATGGISVLMALATGLAPALQGLWSGNGDALRPAGRVTGGRTGLWRTGLLVVQAALCVLLLVGAGLFVKSLHAVRTHDVGIDLDRVIEASLPNRTGTSVAQAEALYGPVLERVAAIPGVERVAMTRRSQPVSIRVERTTLQEMRERAAPMMTVVTSGYFATLGSTLERGRDLTLEDERLRARVAVINRRLAAEYWPGMDPLGQCMQLGSDANCTEVIGIVENILLFDRADIDHARLFISPSHPFGAGRPTSLLIRARGDARPLVPVVRGLLQSLTPDMPFVTVDTVEALTAPQLRPWRLGTTVFLAFGAVALLIAAVGLYSTMAHAVSQRTREIGVRMALGATPWHVIRVVGAHGAATLAAGIAIGLVFAGGATRWLADLLYDTSPRDPVVFSTAAFVLLAVGMAAAVLPVRRSTAVDPVAALRAE